MTIDEAIAKDPPQPTRIQSVSRAVRILMAIASSGEGMTVKQVADRIELSTPTAYHLLNTLVHEGMLFKDERRRYLLGPGASVISDAYNKQNLVPDRYIKALHALAAESGETAYLSAWRNGAISVLATVEGSHAVRVAGLTTGYSDNVHARASGKLLLAFAPESVRESVLAQTPLLPVTPNTIVSRERLERELALIRSTGVAYDRQEFREGVDCVSVPIHESGTVVACFTLSCPADRFASGEADIVATLKMAAEAAAVG